jgi:hypothetical protein
MGMVDWIIVMWLLVYLANTNIASWWQSGKKRQVRS